jgi:hypothetical protein
MSVAGPVSGNARCWPQLPRRERLSSPSAGQPGSQPNKFTSWLSFRRIIDISFETCVAALESWQLTGHNSELHVGQSLLRGAIEHDRCSGTYRIEVRLARGPLRPRLCMRLDIDRWSWAPSRTALELIPCRRARPTPAYFWAGHLLLDSLTYSLTRHVPAQRFDGVPANRPHVHSGEPQSSVACQGARGRNPSEWSHDHGGRHAAFQAESTDRRREPLPSPGPGEGSNQLLRPAASRVLSEECVTCR